MYLIYSLTVDSLLRHEVVVRKKILTTLQGHSGTWHMPLTLLIDGDSASSSEIFAGAIRDHNRGKIIGSRSYGKGSIQGIFPMDVAGVGMRLTTAHFYSPTGQPYSRVGVSPDLWVQQTCSPRCHWPNY
jgi:carboxyl-terminal processing protease